MGDYLSSRVLLVWTIKGSMAITVVEPYKG